MMIPARTEVQINQSIQTTDEALELLKSARSKNVRVKTINGNLFEVRRPENIFGKIIYAIKLYFFGSSDLGQAMIAIREKMHRDIVQAHAHIDIALSSKLDQLQFLGCSGKIGDLHRAWSDLIKIIHSANAPVISGKPHSLGMTQAPSVTGHQAVRGDGDALLQQLDQLLGEHQIPLLEFNSFRKQLHGRPQFPSNLSIKAENSLALALLLEQRQGKSWAELDALMGPRLVALQLVQAESPASSLSQDLAFAKELCDRLDEAGFEIYEFSAFKEDLLSAQKIPGGLVKRTEISAAIAVIQEQKKGRSLDEAARLIQARIKALPQIQQRVPVDLAIDCVHEGMTFRDDGSWTAEEREILCKGLRTLSDYPETTNAGMLDMHPLLEKLPEEFAKDCFRNPPILIKSTEMNSAIEEKRKLIRESTDDPWDSDNDSDGKMRAVRDQWLADFIQFFGDEKVAKVASHYLYQVSFGCIAAACREVGRSWISVFREPDDDTYAVDETYTAELVEKDGKQKCLISANSKTFGRNFMASNFREGHQTQPVEMPNLSHPFLPVSSPGKSSWPEPVATLTMEIELDVEEMSRLQFNPRVLTTQIACNFQLDWQRLDLLIRPANRPSVPASSLRARQPAGVNRANT